MNVIHIAFFNIVQMLLHALHISSEIVNVKHHSQHVVLFVPIWLGFSGIILPL